MEYCSHKADVRRVKGDTMLSLVLPLQIKSSQNNTSSAVINQPVLCVGDTGQCLLLSRYLVSRGPLDAGISFIGVYCVRVCRQIAMCETKRQITLFFRTFSIV